jgi:hypothetical protein
MFFANRHKRHESDNIAMEIFRTPDNQRGLNLPLLCSQVAALTTMYSSPPRGSKSMFLVLKGRFKVFIFLKFQNKYPRFFFINGSTFLE